MPLSEEEFGVLADWVETLVHNTRMIDKGAQNELKLAMEIEKARSKAERVIVWGGES